MTLAPSPSPVISFDASQRRLFEDRRRVLVVVWHRQKGKDFTTAAKAVDDALRTGNDWFVVSLTQRQADATFDKAKRVAKAIQNLLRIRGEPVEGEGWVSEQYDKTIRRAFQFKARELVLPGGGRVVSLPGRDPDTLAGLTGNVVFTEFGLFPGGGYDHWRVVFPLATRGFQVMAISTPRGRNTKFYELFANPDDYGVHFCDIHQSADKEGFVLLDNNGLPTTIEAFRRLYADEAGWEREYECQFGGDLSSLVTWAQLEEAGALAEGREFRFLRIDDGQAFDPGFFAGDYPRGTRLEIGWDVARTGHLSAVSVNAAVPGMPRHLGFVVAMRNCPFDLQRRVVEAAMDARPMSGGHYRAAVGAGDATGLGMESNEVLARRYPERWEGVAFGPVSKADLGSRLATAFADRQQAIPPIGGEHGFVGQDVYALRKDLQGDRLRIEASENPLLPESHCDLAMSLALALRAGARHAPDPAPAPLAVKPRWLRRMLG